MKIAYCIPATYNSAGMERVLAKKVNYIVREFGWEVVIITTCQKGRPSFYKMEDSVKYIDLDIDYESIFNLPVLQKIKARKRAAKIHRQRLEETLEAINPDITVSMFTHEMKFLPLIKAGGKKVLELHFSKNFRSLDAKANNKSAIMRVIGNVLDKSERSIIKLYDKFVVLSEQDANDWGSGYKNIEVISNPSTFTPEVIADADAKRTLALGRLCQQKGFDMLVDAWAKIPENKRNGWALDIVGSGPDKDKIENKIKELHLEDSVVIKNPVKDVKSLYAAHSIFCFPSRYEGLGMTLMEAMSFGLAPVSFDCPCGPSEMIAEVGSGALVKLNDIDGFAEKLAAYMSDPALRKETGIKASRYINDNYSDRIIMAKWDNLFNSLVN